MKLYIFALENKSETFIEYDKSDFFEGFYDPYTKIIDKEAKEKLKKLKIDIDELYKKEMSLEAVLEDLDEDKKEEVEYILNDLNYLPQAYPSCYCEDIHDKKDIEGLEDNLYFLDNDGFVLTKDDILSWDYDTYYHWWNGHNHRCAYVEWWNELEVKKADEDEIQKFEEQCYYENSDYMRTYHYNYYKTPDEKLFRVFVSYYQGSLDAVDEEFGDWKEIELVLRISK